MRIADWITIVRIPLGVLILIMAIAHLWGWALAIILIAIITDVVDGEIARRYEGGATPRGEVLEDVSDTCFTAGAMAGLVLTHHLPLLVVVIVVAFFLPFAAFVELCREGTIWRKLGNGMTPLIYFLVLVYVVGQYMLLTRMPLLTVVLVEILVIIVLAIWKRKRIVKKIQGKVA